MYYVDRFLGEVVKEKNNFDPPERYYEYRRGFDDEIITETYIVSYYPLRLIDFSYTIDRLRRDGKSISMERNILLEEHGISKNPILYAYTVPSEWYEEEVARINE